MSSLIQNVRIAKRICDEYVSRLQSGGEDGLFRFIVGNTVCNKKQHNYPEIVLLDRAEAFFKLYRRNGDENFFVIGRILRRAAHRLYREFRRIDKDYPVNRRFLNLVNVSN